MKQIALVVSCVVLLSVGAALRTARPPMIAEDSQSLEEKYTPTESEVAEIRSLIHDLREIADPHVGLSPTMSGTGFAPVPWAVEMHGDILMNHGLKESPAIARLVEYTTNASSRSRPKAPQGPFKNRSGSRCVR